MGASRIAIVLGAGFSAAAGWPDTTKILDKGAWLVGRSQAARYRRVWESYSAWLTANPASSGDEFLAAVHHGGVRGMDWPSVVEVIAGTIASAGAASSPLVSPRYADSLMRPNLCATHQAFFADALDAGVVIGVVSMNYDLLAEKILRPHSTRRPPRPGFHYGGLPKPQVCVGRSSSPFPRDRATEPLELSGRVPVFKPHGSLNWHRIFTDWKQTQARIAIYPDLRAAFRGRGDAAIVPPVATETTVPPWLESVWRGVGDLLASADEWRIVGYSLPAADVALAARFRFAAFAGRVASIRVWNRTNRTRQRWEAIAQGVRVTFEGPL